MSSRGVPCATISPPCTPAPGPHVDDVVGREDGLAVVLDDDDRVAEVAQARLRLDEARVVARVQADARLVEHVEDADERRADLRREADALPLAATRASARCGRA